MHSQQISRKNSCYTRHQWAVSVIIPLIVSISLFGTITATATLENARFNSRAPIQRARYPSPLDGWTEKHISTTELPPLMRVSPNIRHGASNIRQEGANWQTTGSSSCYVFDDHRFIYVRIVKTGSTTLAESYLRKELGIRITSCDLVPRYKWLHYFVFTIVRNSWDRALSQFLACFHNHLNPEKASQRVNFGEWCWNPAMYGNTFCGAAGTFKKTVLGSEDGLDLIKLNEHLGFQYKALCTPQHECFVDYVGHLDTLEQDMRIVVDHINSRLPYAGWLMNQTAKMPYYDPNVHFSAGHNTRDPTGVKKRRNPCSYQTYYADYPHCVRAIEAWFWEDIKHLGFSFHNRACESTDTTAVNGSIWDNRAWNMQKGTPI